MRFFEAPRRYCPNNLAGRHTNQRYANASTPLDVRPPTTFRQTERSRRDHRIRNSILRTGGYRPCVPDGGCECRLPKVALWRGLLHSMRTGRVPGAHVLVWASTRKDEEEPDSLQILFRISSTFAKNDPKKGRVQQIGPCISGLTSILTDRSVSDIKAPLISTGTKLLNIVWFQVNLKQ